ncbi:MAG: hypothetical protein ILO42_02075 [Clostridia bacterium]|nr:hypothetical protein [Clostridia bacterium]
MKPDGLSALKSARGFAAERIIWLHERVKGGSYPNSSRLCDRFGISEAQAHRDVRLLRQIGAPLKYNASREGFEYTSRFDLPEWIGGNESESTVSAINASDGESGGIQMTIPYTARVRLSSKIAAGELGRFVVSRSKGGVYDCEFRNPGFFAGMLLACDPDAEVVSPDWLRELLTDRCERLKKANS